MVHTVLDHIVEQPLLKKDFMMSWWKELKLERLVIDQFIRFDWPNDSIGQTNKFYNHLKVELDYFLFNIYVMIMIYLGNSMFSDLIRP